MIRPGRTALALAAVAACLLLLGLTPAAVAQSKNVNLRARAIFEGGSKRLDAGDLEGALELYRDALELAPKAKILLNVALLELKLGYKVAAANSLAAYTEHSNASAKALTVVRAELEKLDAELAKLSIDTALSVEIFIDDKSVGKGPGTLLRRVKPGEHRVHAPGAVPQRVHLQAGGNARATLRALPPKVLRSAEAPGGSGQNTLAALGTTKAAAHETRSPLWRRPWVWTGAMTAGIAGTGLVFGLQSRSASDEVDRLNAMSENHDFSEAVPLIDRAESRGTLANIAFIAAGVGGAVTLYLAITDPGSPQRRPRAALTPVPGGAMGSYAIRF